MNIMNTQAYVSEECKMELSKDGTKYFLTLIVSLNSLEFKELMDKHDRKGDGTIDITV